MLTSDKHQIKRALISVSDKSGIVDFVKELVALGIEIYSTGGTFSLLEKNNIPAKKVSDITNFPEILDGRVKTLHPKIHGGLLGELDKEKHLSEMKENGIESIDLLIVNLYPFEQTLKNTESSHEDIVENIDIGGPGMIRAAAKNYKWTLPLVNPDKYPAVLDYLKNNNLCVPEDFRLLCSAEVYTHTAAYDAMIANYMNGLTCKDKVPSSLLIAKKRAQDLRYGENPHQSAALYGDFFDIFHCFHGKELSYNNIADIDATVRLILEFDEPTVAIIKHTTPCGVGSADTVLEAYRKAYATDTQSPFGGIIALNKPFDKELAEELHPIFTEVLIAPSFTDEAIAILTKKRDRRLVTYDLEKARKSVNYDFRSIFGGVIAQSSDAVRDDVSLFKCVTEKQPTEEELNAALFGWKIVKHVKSNAIVFASKDRTLGIGGGQTSRVESARIAVNKAKEFNLDLKDCVCASDAYFPFADGLLMAAEAGAKIIIQPGGSTRDQEVIDAANKAGVVMIFTGVRHFRH